MYICTEGKFEVVFSIIDTIFTFWLIINENGRSRNVNAMYMYGIFVIKALKS